MLRRCFIPALSLFLILAGLCRFLETNSGNTFIFDINVESWEGFLYKGRVYRPISAQALNRFPGVLLIGGKGTDRHTFSQEAMDYSNAGSVVLVMQDLGQGETPSTPDIETENAIDSGYDYLSTRTFVDSEHLTVVCYDEACNQIDKTKHAEQFTEIVSSKKCFGILTVLRAFTGLSLLLSAFSLSIILSRRPILAGVLSLGLILGLCLITQQPLVSVYPTFPLRHLPGKAIIGKPSFWLILAIATIRVFVSRKFPWGNIVLLLAFIALRLFDALPVLILLIAYDYLYAKATNSYVSSGIVCTVLTALLLAPLF